jgi:hypothetical protein
VSPSNHGGGDTAFDVDPEIEAAMRADVEANLNAAPRSRAVNFRPLEKNH